MGWGPTRFPTARPSSLPWGPDSSLGFLRQYPSSFLPLHWVYNAWSLWLAPVTEHPSLSLPPGSSPLPPLPKLTPPPRLQRTFRTKGRQGDQGKRAKEAADRQAEVQREIML